MPQLSRADTSHVGRWWWSVDRVTLMALAVATRSPIGALSQSFNLVPYGRNLLHIWREQGTLTPFRRRLANVATVAIAVIALCISRCATSFTFGFCCFAIGCLQICNCCD